MCQWCNCLGTFKVRSFTTASSAQVVCCGRHLTRAVNMFVVSGGEVVVKVL